MKHLKIETVEELVKLIQVIVWGFVVFVLMLVLGGIVGSMVYSVMFIAQPMKAMSPIDQAFTKMLNDIVLILASSVTTIVSMFAVNKASQAIAEKIAPTLGIPPTTPPQPQAVAPSVTPVTTATGVMPDFNWMGTAPVQFDEEWRAPPPPTTSPDHLHPEREEIAQERAAAEMEKQ
jgi:hypothetical protein